VKTLAATLARFDRLKTEYELETSWGLYTNVSILIVFYFFGKLFGYWDLNANCVNCGLEQ
jgi:hypothetical protein